MAQERDNIVLIGMPGSGKSTVGVVLAKQTGRGFIDSDLIIQSMQGKTLQQIVDARGFEVLRQVEEDALLSLAVENHVVATGGSAVYSEAGMSHLKRLGQIVFLDVDLPSLEARVGDFSQRGIAMRPDQSFADLFAERVALYRQYADITVAGGDAPHETVAERIHHALR
ncbi:MAG: shikimate kinase [Planctomycetota bacterium]